MKSKDLTIGGVYAVKVSGRICPVRIDSVSTYGGWTCKNLRTERGVHVRGAARFRYPLEPYENGDGVRRWRRIEVPAPAPLTCGTCGRELDPKRCVRSNHTGARYCWPGEGCQAPKDAGADVEYADEDEAGQLALGVAGEQRAIPTLARPKKWADMSAEEKIEAVVSEDDE